MRSGCATGIGLSRSAFSRLKMAVLPPMPTASAKTATSVKPGDLRRVRSA